MNEEILTKVYNIFNEHIIDGNITDDTFLEMMSNPKVYNTLMYMCSGISDNIFEQYNINIENPVIEKNIRIHGNTYKKVYECFQLLK